MALRYITREASTGTLVSSELIKEGRRIDAMIRRIAENRGWGVQETNNHLDAGKTLYVVNGPYRHELYYTNREE